MSISRKKQYEFINKLGEHCPMLYEIPFQERYAELQLLLRRGSAYLRIQERYCNESMDDRTENALRKREKNLEKRITEFLTQLNAKPVFDGDPRGHTVKIVCPDGYTDDWGGEGLCLPTS